MWFDWIGGWASHGMAWYIGVIMGLLGGIFLTWYGEDSKRTEQDVRHGSTTREGDHHAGPGAR
jgi:hypothetical protein